METKKRFKPTLAQYRHLEDKLWVANGHIELGTKQLSDLQRKHDIQEAITKDLMERKTALEGKVAEHEKVYERLRYDLNCTDAHFQDTLDKLKSLNKLSFVLAFVTIAYSAIQIAHAIKSL